MATRNESTSTGHEKTPVSSFEKRNQRKTATFPMILHYMLSELEKDSLGHLMCWQPNGLSFIVRNPKQVEKTIIPLWFRQSKFTSFQRQLNLYGFNRITTGPDAGGYHHKLFVRGKASLAERIGRTIGTHSRKLNFTGSDPGVEAISNLHSEGWKSGETKDLDADKCSTNPTITRAAAATASHSPLPTLWQSGYDLNVDRSKETHRQCTTSLVPCCMAKYATLAPTYTLKEAINITPVITRQSSQPYFGRAQVAAGHLIQQQQEQVQSERYTSQAHKMAYLRAEVMKTLLNSAVVVPTACSREDYERLCLHSTDTIYDNGHVLSMNTEDGFQPARPFAPGRSGRINGMNE